MNCYIYNIGSSTYYLLTVITTNDNLVSSFMDWSGIFTETEINAVVKKLSQHSTFITKFLDFFFEKNIWLKQFFKTNLLNYLCLLSLGSINISNKILIGTYNIINYYYIPNKILMFISIQ